MENSLTTADYNRIHEFARRMVDDRKKRVNARKRSQRRARRLKKRFGD